MRHLSIEFDVFFRILVISAFAFDGGTAIMVVAHVCGVPFVLKAWLYFGFCCWLVPAVALINWAVTRPK